MRQRPLARLFTCGLVLALAACGRAASLPIASPTPQSLVPWIDTPAPAPPPPVSGTTSGAPPCTAATLRIGWGGTSGIGGGRMASAIVFWNIGDSDCALSGYPRIELLGTSQAPLKLEARPGFDNKRPVVLNAHGTPPASPGLTPGEGEAVIEWRLSPSASGSGQCMDAQVSAVRLQIPNDPTTLSIKPSAADQFTLAPCDGWYSVNAFTGPAPEQSPPPVLDFSATTPTQVAAGDWADFVITVTNPGRILVAWPSPCPGYRDDLFDGHSGAIVAKSHYALNCTGLGQIEPLVPIRFDMRARAPAGTPAGSYMIYWQVDGWFAQTQLLKIPVKVTG